VIQRPVAILALLTALNLVNYVDRFLVMAVSERFGAEFGLSDRSRGAVVTAFMIGYMLTSPIFGYLGDRMQRKGLIAAGVALWSIATVLSGTTGGFVSMFAARIAVGVGEASYATLSPTIIDDLAPKASKSSWLAIFYAAIPVGAALGWILGGVLEPLYGWRSAFFIAGGPGILLAAVTLLIREPSRVTLEHGQRGARTANVYRALLRTPQYRLAVLGYVAQTFALGGFSEWAVPLLSRKLCFPLGRSNIIFGAITAATGLTGTLAGGWIADRIRGDDRTRASLVLCAWSSAIAAPVALAALLQGSATAFLVVLGVTELAIFVSTSPTNAALLDSVPVAMRANAMAASIFAIHLLGDLLSPIAVGTISDAFHDAQGECTGARGLVIGMYLLPAALAVSAFAWFRGAAAPRVTHPDTA